MQICDYAQIFLRTKANATKTPIVGGFSWSFPPPAFHISVFNFIKKEEEKITNDFF